MQLITSAAYINSELQSEFGEIPPSFLPLGNRRLFEHQRSILNADLDCYLSVPESYLINKRDKQRLDELNITIVPVPSGLQLGDSIVFVLNYIGLYNEPLSILHGDTLFEKILRDTQDWFSVATSNDNYDWGKPKPKLGGNSQIFSGFFSFSDTPFLVKSLLRCGGKFIDAIHAYSDEIECEYHETYSWYDFGHTKTYYRSKSEFTTQRHFNNLSITPLTVRKSSSQISKIEAEAYWYKNLPLSLKPYAPSVYFHESRNGESEYIIEYLPLAALNELYVFGGQPVLTWAAIFDACEAFILNCQAIKPETELNFDSANFYLEKTGERLESFAYQQKVDLDASWKLNSKPFPSLNTVMDEINRIIQQNQESTITAFHGDFCFSNILYDFRQQRIKAIDPRGIDFRGEKSIWGDIQYDIAKLSHSVVGLYDFIMCGYYDLKKTNNSLILDLPSDERISNITSLFRSRTFGGISANSPIIRAIEINLFLSMLPLHNDCPKKQFALLANGLRLFEKLNN